MSRHDRGQASAEFALVLPVVLISLLIVLQAGLVVRAQILLTHAARDAARTTAIHGEAGPGRRAAARTPGLDPARLTVEVRGPLESGTVATVDLRYVFETDVPLVGALIGDQTLTASLSMRVE